jgi:hypothetical protein
VVAALPQWHPTKDEVARIVNEMRPIMDARATLSQRVLDMMRVRACADGRLLP